MIAIAPRVTSAALPEEFERIFREHSKFMFGAETFRRLFSQRGIAATKGEFTAETQRKHKRIKGFSLRALPSLQPTLVHEQSRSV